VNKGKIHFFAEEIKFSLPQKKKTKNWINSIICSENKVLGNLNIIFCSDKYLHDLNIKYLNHDTLTDIITFDYAEMPDEISGDIFISIERVTENSKIFKNSFSSELNRVIAHGILHLIGYQDKTTKEARIIRQKEDYYLSLLPNFILG
jgi:probable rRNA maturation factor